MQRLIAQLDPVGTAFNRLVEQQKQLNEAKAKGMLSPEMYEELSGKLRAMRSELEVTQSQLSKTGMSAKQTAFAMRMLPVQMTDIVVGLSTGQSPFMVLMQQGGHSAMQETRIASLPVTAIPAGMKIPCVTAGSA